MGKANPTAVAVGRYESDGVTLTSVIEGLYGTDSVIAALDSIEDLHGVSIDGPLVITNESGQRDCETQIGRTYGGRKASCHTSSLERFPDAAGIKLSSHLGSRGFLHLAVTSSRWQLECYPHPAILEIFGLAERLLYKKGSVTQKRAGQIELARLISSLIDSPIVPLAIPEEYSSYLHPDRINALQGKSLKHNEDVLDAIVCMYIGALYQAGVCEQVFGSVEGGYIYVPRCLCISRASVARISEAHPGRFARKLDDTLVRTTSLTELPPLPRCVGADMAKRNLKREDIVATLARHKQRATYGALAGILGGLARSVMSGESKTANNSWVVAAKTGLPTGYTKSEMDPDLKIKSKIISDGDELFAWLRSLR